MEIRALILGCIFLCSLSLLAQEKKDLIVMKNGDRFTGEIKGLSGGTLFVSLDYVDGNIAVQWSEVAHLESRRLFVVKTESGVVYTGKIATEGASNDPPSKLKLSNLLQRKWKSPNVRSS